MHKFVRYVSDFFYKYLYILIVIFKVILNKMFFFPLLPSNIFELCETFADTLPNTRIIVMVGYFASTCDNYLGTALLCCHSCPEINRQCIIMYQFMQFNLDWLLDCTTPTRKGQVPKNFAGAIICKISLDLPDSWSGCCSLLCPKVYSSLSLLSPGLSSLTYISKKPDAQSQMTQN